MVLSKFLFFPQTCYFHYDLHFNFYFSTKFKHNYYTFFYLFFCVRERVYSCVSGEGVGAEGKADSLLGRESDVGLIPGLGDCDLN